jgi:hypothetical protein
MTAAAPAPDAGQRKGRQEAHHIDKEGFLVRFQKTCCTEQAGRLARPPKREQERGHGKRGWRPLPPPRRPTSRLPFRRSSGKRRAPIAARTRTAGAPTI